MADGAKRSGDFTATWLCWAGRYLVMIDPDSLVDVIPFGEIAIDAALVGTATHRIFASTNPLAPHIREMIQEREGDRVQYNGSMYVMKPVPELGFTVVTWAPLKPLADNWHRQLLFWLPFGMLISLLAALFVFADTASHPVAPQSPA
jgi:sensor c-di-GMP phosphodiesterase-like protein